MGASEDSGDDTGAAGAAGDAATAGGGQDGNADRGFPENTPVAAMSDEQRANYYRFQNRQTDNKLAAFKGVTPKQVEAMQSELETLRNEKLSADEKAVKEATQKAQADAKAAADAEWRPKYLASQLKSLAAGVLSDPEQLASFMAVTDAGKFAGEDGEIDEDKVIGHLTALFGGGGGSKVGQPQQRPNWGQHSGGNTASTRPGDAGRAAAAKRFGTST